MFQFPRSSFSLTICFISGYYNVTCSGFPHSDICESMFTSNSSQLFAGSHVLLRHIVPRHSPNALTFLCFVFVTFPSFSFLVFLSFFHTLLFSIRKNFHIQFSKIAFFFSSWEFYLSKLDSTRRLLSKHSFFSSLFILLRKEVIHPHVPVGIPCYDLTPIIGSTLGTSLLFRLG